MPRIGPGDLGRRNQRCGRAGACAKVTHRQTAGLGIIRYPVGCLDEPLCKQVYIESQMAGPQIDLFFIGGK
jgi:hypothetical protein